MLDLATVGVVNHVFEVQPLPGHALGRGPHGEDLVGTDTEMPVRQEPVLPGREVQAVAGFVQHNEIIAGALHFGEADLHERIIP